MSVGGDYKERHRPLRTETRALTAPRDPGFTSRLEAVDDVADEGRGLARGLADADAGLLQGFLLGLGGSGRAGDDRARVPHGLALRGHEPGHVADDRLGHVLLDERGRPLLGVPADLADH